MRCSSCPAVIDSAPGVGGGRLHTRHSRISLPDPWPTRSQTIPLPLPVPIPIRQEEAQQADLRKEEGQY